MAQAETEVLEQETETEESETEEVATGDESEETAEGEGSETEESEVTVTIGDEEAPDSEEEESRAPEWVRDLRKSNRELQRKNRELEQKLTTAAAPEKAVAVGEEPTLEGCDYDTDRFKKDFKAWTERQREAEQKEAKKRETAEAEKKSWQATLDTYGKKKTELKVKDFEDAEGIVLEQLSVTQQGVILQGADNPALLVYALGRNAAKAKELAAITDPVKFAFAIAKLETQLKVTTKKSAPLPEKTVRGSAPVSGNADSTLERLRTEAAKTGDYTKVRQHKQQMKAKQK